MGWDEDGTDGNSNGWDEDWVGLDRGGYQFWKQSAWLITYHVTIILCFNYPFQSERAVSSSTV